MSRLARIVRRASGGRRRPSSPLVSVVVPVFGTEAYLADCLSSLLRQTLTDIEIVVVDDCSPGDAAAIVARVAGDDQRVRLVRHDENLGLMQARLTGGREARGAYLGFVDSDDVVEDWFVEVLHGAAVRHGADLVECAIVFEQVDGTVQIQNRGGEQHQLHGAAIMHAVLEGRLSNNMCNKLVRTPVWRAAVEHLRPEWSTVFFAEDMLFLFLLVQQATSYAHVPDAGYHYIRRAESITLAADIDSVVSRVTDLGRVYEVVHSVLAARHEPPELVATFFHREFAIVVDELFGQLAATPGPAGLPAAPVSLGLLGAMVADGLARPR